MLKGRCNLVVSDKPISLNKDIAYIYQKSTAVAELRHLHVIMQERIKGVY